MDGCALHALIKPLRFIVARHERDDKPRAALLPQRREQRLRHFVVPLAFQNADPVEIRTDAIGIDPAGDERSVDPPDHRFAPPGEEGEGRIEPGIGEALFKLRGVGIIRLPEIGARLLPPQFPFKRERGGDAPFVNSLISYMVFLLRKAYIPTGGAAARRYGFNRSASRRVTNCNLTSQVGAFAAAFLCCTFSLPAAYNFFFCQVQLWA